MTPFPIICHSLLCLSVCPAIKAYISVTMSWIWMKLGAIDCIKISKRVIGQRGKHFFFAFLCVSEHFKSIETLLFFRKFSWARSAKRARASCKWVGPIDCFMKKSFSSFILFFRNCVCCKRLWLLRPSNLVVTVFLWLQKRLSSQSFCDSRNDYLSLSLSVCLFVCLSVLLLKPISR